MAYFILFCLDHFQHRIYNAICCVQNQQRELTVRHAREADKEMRRHLDIQKNEYEEAIKRHLSFIDQARPSVSSHLFQF